MAFANPKPHKSVRHQQSPNTTIIGSDSNSDSNSNPSVATVERQLQDGLPVITYNNKPIETFYLNPIRKVGVADSAPYPYTAQTGNTQMWFMPSEFLRSPFGDATTPFRGKDWQRV